MGCCGTKEKQVSAAESKGKENPEESSLRHPKAEARVDKKDEELAKSSQVQAEPNRQGQKEVQIKQQPLNQAANVANVSEIKEENISPKKVSDPSKSPQKEQVHEQPKMPESVKHLDSPSKLDRTLQKDDILVKHDDRTKALSSHNDSWKSAVLSYPLSNLTKYFKLESPKNLKKDSPIQHRKNEYPEVYHLENDGGRQQGTKAKIDKGEVEAAKMEITTFSLKKILDTLNDIRTNPSKYAERVQVLYLDHINDKGINMRTKIMTNEGKVPYADAKRFLTSQKPISKCELDDGLTAAAYLHSVYCAAIGEQTHTSKDGGGPMDRIKDFGMMLQGMCAENVLSKSQIDAEEWILDFIIDDGCPSRGHRKNIFNPQVSKIGLGVARQAPNSDWYFTMDFTSSSYKSDTSKIPADVKVNCGLKDYHRQIGY